MREGKVDDPLAGRSNRWVRSSLRIEREIVTVDVNSQARLAALPDELGRIGHRAVMVATKETDPSVMLEGGGARALRDCASFHTRRPSAMPRGSAPSRKSRMPSWADCRRARRVAAAP